MLNLSLLQLILIDFFTFDIKSQLDEKIHHMDWIMDVVVEDDIAQKIR
jgi:hypothetical protein